MPGRYDENARDSQIFGGKSHELKVGVAEEGIALGIKGGMDFEPEDGSQPGTEDGMELGYENGLQQPNLSTSQLGTKDSVELGSDDGSELGTNLGSELGITDIIEDGMDLGSEDGLDLELGTEDGIEVGSEDGLEPGIKDGIELGSEDGAEKVLSNSINDTMTGFELEEYHPGACEAATASNRGTVHGHDQAKHPAPKDLDFLSAGRL